MEKELSQEEKRLISAYFEPMETLTRWGWYKGVPSADMRRLQQICREKVDASQPVQPFCGHCCARALRCLYPLAEKIRRGGL